MGEIEKLGTLERGREKGDRRTEKRRGLAKALRGEEVAEKDRWWVVGDAGRNRYTD